MYNIPNSQKCEIDDSYCKFGSQAILELLEGFEKNLNGVEKNEDIECVHRTRVASRKLRAILPLYKFCFPRKKYKKWLKEIKKVTSLLGQARDLDVQITFVKQYCQQIGKVEKKHISILLRNRVKCRDEVQPKIITELAKLKASGILENIRSFCEEKIEGTSTEPFDVKQVLQRAQWQILFRLDDFLAYGKFVEKEAETIKHHEMRIEAKNLRYVMESFAPQYADKLQDEIRTLKNYQDLLGEKHDLEVWLEFIPEFIEETNSQCRKKIDVEAFKNSLLAFSKFISEERKQRYLSFVQLWTENKTDDFFEMLRDKTNVGLSLNIDRSKQVLENSHVKVAVLSDVHANLQALQRVIQDAEKRGVDLFLNAGDSLGYGPNPNECVECLCEKNALSTIGNYDLEVIEGKANAKGEKKLAWKFTKKELTRFSEGYLKSLPRELRLEAQGKRMLVTHGSPESIEEHIYHDTPVERLMTLAGCAKADVIVIGHSHEQFCRQSNGVYFINPGSVGRPSDENPQTAYALLSFNPFNVELIRLNYDVEEAADELLKKGLPESFAQMLLRGVSLDAITEDDKRKKDLTIENCQLLVAEARRFAQKHGQESKHYAQVTQLALTFFDSLKEEHHLSECERCWLECAAILHDIGLLNGTRQHNRKSAKIILHDTTLPFTSQERQIIASITRYHRNGPPKNRHYNLAAFDSTTIHKVQVLSGLLRVADGLDYTHTSNVKSLKFSVGVKTIAIECIAETQSTLEKQAFNKKKDLLETALGKKLVLRWKQQ
jgi:putative phosphoesterase